MSPNAVGKASGYQLVAPVDNKRPDIVLHMFMQLWIIPLGVPHNILSDNGGEFDAEFAESSNPWERASSGAPRMPRRRTPRAHAAAALGRPMLTHSWTNAASRSTTLGASSSSATASTMQ